MAAHVPDTISREQRSHNMSRIRSRGNATTELALCSLFRRLGITGWRRHQPLPGTPDFVFRSRRIAAFADGCFWHGCPRHYTAPATRRSFWRDKLESNRRRDRIVAARLRAQGWSVWRIWECRIREGTLPSRLLALLDASGGRP